MKDTLFELKRILQRVSMAASQKEQVEAIVHAVVDVMNVDVCSVYLSDNEGYLSLSATVGLDPVAVGNVRLKPGEGLVGMTAMGRHPLNIADAEKHPDYRYFPETHEESYHAFIGVPLVYLGLVFGVLVVQDKQKRSFTEAEEAFLVTIASQLALAVDKPLPREGTDDPLVSTRKIAGVKGAPGIGIGNIHIIEGGELFSVSDRAPDDVDGEIIQLHKLIDLTKQQLEQDAEEFAGNYSDDILSIYSAYQMLLGDDQLLADIEKNIRTGNWIPGALRETVNSYRAMFDTMDDPYLKARSDDIQLLVEKIHANWCGTHGSFVNRGSPIVLAGNLISISDIAKYKSGELVGIICFSGSTLSHTAILANAMGIPAVMGIDPGKSLVSGSRVIVDGHQGQVIINPSSDVVIEFEKLLQEEQTLLHQLEALKDTPAVTPDNVRIKIYANSGLLSDISPGLERGAEGIGLYRTEIPFMIRQNFPSEDEQYNVYRHVLDAYKGKPVYIRTLDIGGDKPLSYFTFKEDNPSLGWRGIRFTLSNSSIFMTQIRAMLRASEGLDNLHILLPMVSRTDELDSFIDLLNDAHQQMIAEGLEIQKPSIGVMVEVPAAIPQLKFWVKRIDFISIGSNDLAQYLLAVDRNNSSVSALYDHVQPGVLHVVNVAIKEAKALGLQAGICGQMASDPVAAVLLLGMGIDTMSMSAFNLPKIKWLIQTVPVAKATDLLQQALQIENEKDIRKLVVQELSLLGLAAICQ